MKLKYEFSPELLKKGILKNELQLTQIQVKLLSNSGRKVSSIIINQLNSKPFR